MKAVLTIVTYSESFKLSDFSFDITIGAVLNLDLIIMTWQIAL